MAIGWLSALKLVPWGEVIEAAPAVVGSAKKFFSRTQHPAPAPLTPADAHDIDSSDPLTRARAQIAQLEATVAQLAERQHASAELIESLAEQHQKVVQALEALRKRLVLLFVLVLVGFGGAALWLAR